MRIASFRNWTKQEGRVVSVSRREVVVEIENRRITYRGVYAEYRVGELVELPLKSHSWSMNTKWSPWDDVEDDD